MELASSEEECDASATMELAVSDAEPENVDGVGLASSDSEFGEPEETQDIVRELESPPSLVAAFRVLFIAVSALHNMFGYSMLRQSALIGGCGLSTHFSGVGSAEIAAGMLQSVVQSCFQGAKDLTVRFACELNQHCARVLLLRGNHCVLKNILDYAPSMPPWSQLSPLSESQRLKLIWECFDASNTPCWRSFHLRCQPSLSQNHGDFSGSPCQPWSSYGKGRGWSDPRSLPFLVWLVFIRKSFHECTQHFKGQPVVEEFLSDIYYVWALHGQPGDCGIWNFIRRPRLFIILIRKNVWLPGHDVCEAYRRICAVIRQSTESEPPGISAVCDACQEEWLLAAENKARAKLKQAPRRSQASFDWRYLLTKKQQGYEKEYLAQWRDKYGTDPLLDDSCLIDLSQARQLWVYALVRKV